MERQRANTKEEDPGGLLNEGWRYRDLEAGVFLSRDPAGMVDGPNLYAYVRQNPWTKFDPQGLDERTVNGQVMSNTDQHRIPVSVMQENDLHPEVAKALDEMRVKTAHPHGAAAHGEYTRLVNEEVKEKIAEMKARGVDPTNSAKTLGEEAKAMARELEDVVTHSKSEYVRDFDKNVRNMTQGELKAWGYTKRAELLAKEGKIIPASMLRMLRKLGVVGKHLPGALKAVGITAAINEFKSDAQAKGQEEAVRTQFYRFGSLTGETPEESRASEKKASNWFFDALTGSKQDQ